MPPPLTGCPSPPPAAPLLQKGAIQSPVLCRALFDLYLGSDPVSPEARASFGQGVAALLAEK